MVHKDPKSRIEMALFLNLILAGCCLGFFGCGNAQAPEIENVDFHYYVQSYILWFDRI